VAGDLINHDQRWPVADQPLEQVSPDRSLELLAFGHLRIRGRPAELIGQLTPQRQGFCAVGDMMDAHGRIEIGANHAGDFDLARMGQPDAAAQQARDRTGRSFAACDMIQRDQVVRLAAAEGRLQADDSVLPARVAGQAAERIFQEGLQAGRGIGVIEEGLWVAIDWISLVIHDIAEPGGKDVFLELAEQYLGAWLASLEYGLHITSPESAATRPCFWVGVNCY